MKLLPYWCKVAGWIAITPLAAIGIFWLANGQPDWRWFNVGIYVVALSLSLLATAFSRERDEDEYTATVRSRCLMAAFWADFVFLAVTAFTVFDLAYLTVMALQMFLILFIHIVLFNITMSVIRRRAGR